MIIKKIELENFRIYKDRHSIDITPRKGKNIFIVSGKNGFGKTTFLMSLVWCLYGRQMGDVDELYQKEINGNNQGGSGGGYSRYIVNSLNRQAKAEGATKFSVALTLSDAIIPELTCDEIKITRTFSLVNPGEEQIQILIDGHENQLIKDLATDKMKGEEIFIRDFLLPIEVAKFFLFDAEKIVSLAEVNSQEQRKNLSKAYSEILGIKKYEDLKKEYEEIQLRLRAQSASKKERDDLIDFQAAVKRCEGDIDDFTEQIKDLKEQKEILKYESEQVQMKLIRAGNIITVEELNALKDDEARLTSTIDTLQASLKDSFDIIPFALAGGKLLEISRQLSEESNFKVNQYKQENISEKTNLILTELSEVPKPKDYSIPYPVQRFYAETFEQLIKKHFFSDTPVVPEGFKVLHEFSETEKNELAALLNNLRSSFRSTFSQMARDYERYNQELRQIRNRIRLAEANAEDPIVQADRQHKAKLDSKISEIDDEIINLNIEINKAQTELTLKERQISELRQKMKVSRANKAKDERVGRIIQRLRDFIAQFQAQKKASLEEQIRKGLHMLMHKKNFIHRVEVKIGFEDIDIDLYNERGDIIRKDTLSKGEQQMYATALLWGLVEESNIAFPVFIDSPMQKFDEEHAMNIVKDFYPSISEQVVLFPLINKELTKKEYQILRPNVVRAYLIYNVNADKSEFRSVEPSKLFETYDSLYNPTNPT
jgi:DNA sulfur modification protein DndD